MVPPLGAHPLLVFLVQAAVLLAAAVLLGRLAERLGMPAVVGELCAGVALGPTVLGHAAPSAAHWLFPPRSDQFNLLDVVGQVGVLLLMGLTGAGLDLRFARAHRGALACISGFGLVVPLVLGVACGLLIPADELAGPADRTAFAPFLGVAMGVSALPVIAKMLQDMDLFHRDVGQLTVSAGMIDDAVGWLLLSLVSALAVTGSSAGTVAGAVAALGLVLALAALLAGPVGGFARRAAGGRDAVAVTTVLILAAAAGTQALRLEAVLGAFLCGIVLRPDPSRVAALHTVVRTVLAPLFFATAGLRMDLGALADPALLALGVLILVVAVAGKLGGAYLGARISRYGGWEALATGAGLNARGVIQIIVAAVGLRLGVLTAAGYTVIVLVSIVTSLMAPPLLRAAMARIRPTEAEDRRRLRQQGTITLVPSPADRNLRTERGIRNDQPSGRAVADQDGRTDSPDHPRLP